MMLSDKLAAVTSQPPKVQAIAFDLVQHLRNRLALALAVFFIPAWLWLVQAVVPDRDVGYHSEVADRVLTVPADDLVTISGAINAVTLIVGFMMFAATRRSTEFERRLIRCGYPRPALLMAKLTGLVLASGVIASYAAVVLTMLWDPHQAGLIGFSLFVSGMTYGAMGIVLGLLLTTELTGMFVIIMVSLVEVMAQNPITNPSLNHSIVRFLPTYGPMQAGATAGFTDQASIGHPLLGLLWTVMVGVPALAVFRRRTNSHVERTTGIPVPAAIPAAVTLTRRADGSLEVRSATGPVLLCSSDDQRLSQIEAADQVKLLGP